MFVLPRFVDPATHALLSLYPGSSVEATSTGVVQLEGAEEYQIRARKKCVCISIIVVVAVAIIVIVILFALKVI